MMRFSDCKTDDEREVFLRCALPDHSEFGIEHITFCISLVEHAAVPCNPQKELLADPTFEELRSCVRKFEQVKRERIEEARKLYDVIYGENWPVSLCWDRETKVIRVSERGAVIKKYRVPELEKFEADIRARDAAAV